MMKKKIAMQAASVLMCAVVMGSTVLPKPVYAEKNESDSTLTETAEDIQDEEIISGMSEEMLSIFFNEASELAVIEKGTALETFVLNILANAEIETDENMRLDWVDADGLRTRLLPAVDLGKEDTESDKDADSDKDDSDSDTAQVGSDTAEPDDDIIVGTPVPTVLELYLLAQEQEDGYTLVVFDDDRELMRLYVKDVAEENTLAIDVVDADDVYAVTFDANGGTLDNDKAMLRAGGEAVSYFENSAVYEKHTFLGWYDAPEAGNEVTEETIVESDMILYARWEQDDMENTDTKDDIEDGTTDAEGNTNDDEKPDTSDTTEGTEKPDTSNMTEDTEKPDTSDTTDDTEKPDASDTTVDAGNTNTTDSTDDTNNTDRTSPANTTDSTSETVTTYTLTVVSLTGTKNPVTVKSNVTIAALTEKLADAGILPEQASAFGLRTSTVTEHAIAGTTTMQEIAELAENGDVLIIGYDSKGKALGSAKVTKTAENTYQVVLSQDTNVALDSSSEKGKGEGEEEAVTNTVSQSGKSDAVVGNIHTDDTDVLFVYGCMGGLLIVLLGVLGFLRRKRI